MSLHLETAWTCTFGMVFSVCVHMHVLQLMMITFRLSCRQRKTCTGHTRLCVTVCLSVSVHGRMPTLLHRPGFAIGAQVALLCNIVRMANTTCQRASACTRYAWFSLQWFGQKLLDDKSKLIQAVAVISVTISFSLSELAVIMRILCNSGKINIMINIFVSTSLSLSSSLLRSL